LAAVAPQALAPRPSLHLSAFCPMGFKDESVTSWLWPLRGSPSSEKKASTKFTEDDSDYQRGFDIADAMERGVARELVTDFVQPLRQSRRLWKFHVKRSEDRRHYRLYCDDGEFLMHAKVSDDSRRVDFSLYDPRDDEGGLYDPQRPAFEMTSNQSRSEWHLVKERCESCRYSAKQLSCGRHGKQEVAFIRHSRKEVGNGTNHCMDVFLEDDGHSETMRGNGGEDLTLVSKMPSWNKEVDSLVLDFAGRQVQSSAKNFQLVPEQRPDYVACQYAKIGSNTFSLDFRYPLTVIQAFGISLTTIFWA